MRIPQLSNYFFEFDLYTPEECSIILLYKENLSPTNYTIKLEDKFYEHGCSMKSQDLTENLSNSWIFEKLQNYLSSKLDLVWLSKPHAVFREYTEGDFFLEHKDNVDKTGADPRYFTVAVQLTDPLEYTGGTVIVNKDRSISKSIGSAALWGSNVVHEVKNIESGIRTSLIFFVSSKHIAINKTSLI